MYNQVKVVLLHYYFNLEIKISFPDRMLAVKRTGVAFVFKELA